jgi:hypothetical protein
MAQERPWIDNRELYLIKEYPVSAGNKLSIRKFFEDNPYYNKDELAKAARRSTVTIDKWAVKSGKREKREPFANPAIKRVPVEHEKVTDRAVWDNPEWFRQKYATEELGIVAISKIIQRRPLIVYRRLKKYGIARRQENNPSKNPCCNEQWLMWNYATPADYRKWCQANKKDYDSAGGKCLPQRVCAELAGVEQFTIYNWLVKFNIPIRDKPESNVMGHRRRNGLLGSAPGASSLRP